jgi:hypothetical protein
MVVEAAVFSRRSSLSELLCLLACQAAENNYGFSIESARGESRIVNLYWPALFLNGVNVIKEFKGRAL